METVFEATESIELISAGLSHSMYELYEDVPLAED